ncbi:MAG: CDP-diacylglycerol--serine O-phosphatidyltransferase [Calditrichaeota bacterium]|nr:MAG: CDP-diacylglycerol--serine O-phosphatidyltransferase [Calditrichota bacterium]
MIRRKEIFPSLFTMLNLFFGFFAIISAVQGKYVAASWMIIIAGICDIIDGKLARKTKTYSEFGIEFDSLSDVVSFGAAPSVLIYQVFFYKIGASGLILSFMPLLFAAIRLARFNINLESYEKESFDGLPTPAMAVTLATYVIFNYDLWEGLRFAPLLAPLVVFLSVLMVSHVEYEAMPKLTLHENKKNTVHLVFMLTGLTLMILFREKAMFPLIFGFVLYGVFKSWLFPSREEEEEDDEILDIYIPD